LYFSEVTDQEATFNNVSLTSIGVQLLPDGRPDFAANPYNGPAPTFAQAQAAGFKQSYSGISGPLNRIPYSHQSSIGLQRQLTTSTAFEADYVYTGRPSATRVAQRESRIQCGHGDQLPVSTTWRTCRTRRLEP